ncbi:hypothetical protein D9615_009119 [Tricholomella constricta]|uniref:Uncharacterized protein n=1 Tax=Tricholomella constricta TaxID=117010 RepID=A0A8H5H0J8_9AGAR|nr:hypothetical protein D9615_009119 [Tricholomella constricta]
MTATAVKIDASAVEEDIMNIMIICSRAACCTDEPPRMAPVIIPGIAIIPRTLEHDCWRECHTKRFARYGLAGLHPRSTKRKYNDERQDLRSALGREAHSADVIYGTRKGAKYLLQYVADTGRFKATFGDVSPYNYKHEDEDDASQPDIDHDYDWDDTDDFGT